MYTRMRSARRIPLLLAVLLVALSLLAPAAGAVDGHDPGDSGGGGSQSNGGKYGVNYECRDDMGSHVEKQANGTWKHIFYRYIALFPRCESGSWISTGKDNLCNTGYEVWRFYSYGDSDGNAKEATPGLANAPYAWTRSQVVSDNWCSNTDANGPISYFYPHPDDYNSRFVDQMPNSNKKGTAWHKDLGGGDTALQNLQRKYYSKSARNVPTSMRPIQTSYDLTGGNAAHRCDYRGPGKHSTDPDTLGQYFLDANGNKGAKYDVEGAADVRKALWNNYLAWKKTTHWSIALTVINAANLTEPKSADELRYNDQLPCSSDMDFATDQGETPIYYGTCFVPTQRRATIFTHTSYSGSVKYAYYTNVRGGPRYEKYPVGDRGNGVPAWRNIIRYSIKNQFTMGSPYTGKGNGNYLTFGSTADRNAAAEAAAIGARCLSVRSAVMSPSKTSTTEYPAEEARVEMTMPSVFQTGWGFKSTPDSSGVVANTVSFSSANLMCKTTSGQVKDCDAVYNSAKTKPNLPLLIDLNFGANITGANGYNSNAAPCTTTEKFPAGSTKRCDFMRTTEWHSPARNAYKPEGTRTSRKLDSAVTLSSRFFSPTQRSTKVSSKSVPAESVQVSVNGGASPSKVPEAVYSMSRATFVTVDPADILVPSADGKPKWQVTPPITVPVKTDPVNAKVPVTVYNKGKQVARFEYKDGKWQRTAGASSWTFNVIGATSFSE